MYIYIYMYIYICTRIFMCQYTFMYMHKNVDGLNLSVVRWFQTAAVQ